MYEYELYNAKRQYKNKRQTLGGIKEYAAEFFDNKHLVYEADAHGWEKIFKVAQKGSKKGVKIHVGWIKYPTQKFPKVVSHGTNTD